MKWLVLGLLTLYGFFVFPGHTFLQSDTQIYVPMFDRISDPSLFGRELVAERQHVSLTIYDEVAIFCKKVAGIDYQYSLGAIQLASRFAGLYGLFLIGTALGLSELAALLVPALAGFGAFVAGPAVITFEYEPVPRGFAVLLTLLALGFAMHGRSIAAASVAGVAFLFHAPAVIPFLAPFIYLQLRERRFKALGILGGSVALAMLLSILQSGSVEPQSFFTKLDPEWEKLQRMRASYNWLSTWREWIYRDFIFHGALASFATWRIWRHMGVRARIYVLSLTWIGILSLPLGWYLMENFKWLLMAQVQPARSILYTVQLSLVLCAVAGIYAVRDRRWWEAPLWFFPPALVAIHKFLGLDPYPELHLEMALVLVVVAAGIAFLLVQNFRWAAVGVVAFACLTGWLFLSVTKQRNFDTDLHHPEINEVARWARENTSKDAMFQLPQFSRSLVSGLFRIKAQRALFVDWKIGGQVNYSRDLSFEWWRRMQIADDKTKSLPSWREQGVDYLVLKAETPLAGSVPLYQNAKYAVYALK